MSPTRRKPKDPFRAPTYYLGGSNSLLTRQGGFILVNVRLVFMTLILLWRIITNCIIENRWNIILKINYLSPSKVLLKS